MDRLSGENDEFSFDDNGLQDAFLLSSWQTSGDSKNDTDDHLRSKCDAITPERDAYESTKIAIGQGKSYWRGSVADESINISYGVPPGSGTVIKTEGTKRSIPNDKKESTRNADKADKLDPSVFRIYKEKETTEYVEQMLAISWEGVRTKKAKFKLKSILCTDSPLTLATVLETCCEKISWKYFILVTVGILFIMPSAGVDGAFTSVPVNNLFLVGKTARINCSTDLNEPVYWARTPVGSNAQQWLYYGNDGFNTKNADGRFRMEKDEASGRYDLIIDDVQQKDAGLYVCIDESGGGARASAELVVSVPIQCNSQIPSDEVMGYNVFGLEQDIIQFSCSLTYTGNTQPTLEWSLPGYDVNKPEPTGSATSSCVTSTLKLPPKKEYNDVKFQCTANIAQAKQQGVDSGLHWESKTVIVKYAEFASIEADGCPGVEWNLICNPQCSHNFEGEGDKCRCVYTYYDSTGQRDYKVASQAVTCAKDNVGQLVVLIVGAVVLVLLVASAGTIMLACCLRKKKTKLHSTPESVAIMQIRPSPDSEEP